jgi:hypothetical protein
VWPYERIHFTSAFHAVLATVSAISTVLFIFGSPCVVLRGSHSLGRASAWAAATAFIVNAHWYVLFGRDGSDLRIGYFLWWFSFLLLAIGLFDLAERLRSSRVTAQVRLITLMSRRPAAQMSCNRRKSSRLQTWRLVSLKVRIISSKEQGLQAVRLVEYFTRHSFSLQF